jgi:hypothetical protein
LTCQLRPLQHLVNAITGILRKLGVPKELDDARITGYRNNLLLQVLNIQIEASGVLKLYAVVVHTNGRVHRAEKIGM